MARLICSFFFLSIFLSTQSINAKSIEIGVYGGVQSSPHSRITGKHSTAGAQYSELVGWEGKSFDAPIYYGTRTTFGEMISWGMEQNLLTQKLTHPVTLYKTLDLIG